MSTKKVHIKAKQIFSNHEHKSFEQVEQDLQIKLQATAQRLRRYTKRNEGFHQNKPFQVDAKKFYRKWSKQRETVIDSSSPGEISLERDSREWGNP